MVRPPFHLTPRLRPPVMAAPLAEPALLVSTACRQALPTSGFCRSRLPLRRLAPPPRPARLSWRMESISRLQPILDKDPRRPPAARQFTEAARLPTTRT